MPYDSVNFVETQPIDLLIEALRGPEPDWFCYSTCETCAIEVAARTVGAPRVSEWVRQDELYAFAAHLGMKYAVAKVIFISDDGNRKVVRTKHVAAALEHYRDTGVALSPFHFMEKERSDAV